jgi:hypothetical protein
VFLASAPTHFTNNATYDPALDFNYLPGEEILTKHKEAIRQLYSFAKVPIKDLIACYKLGKSTICCVLSYNQPERACLTRTGRPTLLSNSQVDEIIEHLFELWDNRILKYFKVIKELNLPCTAISLKHKLK